MIKKNIEPKTWEDFRNTGLLLFINSILHAFGWAIVVEFEDGNIVKAFPARTKFRGFDQLSTEESHHKIANYLAENAPNFPKEIE